MPMFGNFAWGIIGAAGLVVGVLVLLVILYAWPAAALAGLALLVVAVSAGKRSVDKDDALRDNDTDGHY